MKPQSTDLRCFADFVVLLTLLGVATSVEEVHSSQNRPHGNVAS